ncbi:phage integrase N-terminal SAM-like domain-containing protein [Candidatus Haliotispira prima]|uniref:Phage integrase N-terminal SAM-like domain-containing protein n=1 Tax=Candidatus Haliotispira prima TaxID=3034016 RepID=A0ABY8MK79_9SPIO|nr:phage integrase N-terminal SAM-like domain-containing protein [Candidatus Haliotispira prima]
MFFHNKQHPKEMGKIEIEAFLTCLANNRVAATTQNQACNTLMFLHNQVLNLSMHDQNIQARRATQRERISVVLSKEEVKIIPDIITNPRHHLAISLLYG